MTNDDISGLVRKSAADLIKATRALGDKASWQPLEKGRSAANQVAECALISQFAAGALTTKTVGPMDWEAFNKACAALAADPHVAMETLATNTEALSDAIGKLTDDDHAATVTMPWDEVLTLPHVAMMVHWNNTYHEGQVNYIQTLAGE